VAAVGTSDGTTAASGLSAALAASAGSADGSSSASAVSAVVIGAVGSSAGSSTASGDGEAVVGTPPVEEPPPPINEILSAGRGGRILHRNTTNQWSAIHARAHRQRQQEEDRAILECLEHFLAVMEES